VAVGDRVTGVVSPVEVLEVPIDRRQGEDLLDAIAGLVLAHLGVPASAQAPGASSAWGKPAEVGEIVVGLPLNMDGTEGPRAELIRAWGDRIARRCGRTVRFQDERLSSAAAEDGLARSGLTHAQKKARRDARAAAVILQDFLEEFERRNDRGPGAEQA
jgi:RNase H-fold protein (predicted Holliday junction resolvase)